MSQLSAKKCNLTEVVEKALCVVFLFFLIQRLTKMLAERKQVVEQGEDLIASDTSFK